RSARGSQGSWSSPIRATTSARFRSANWPGWISPVWGSWPGRVRLSTRTRSPPTAATRSRRSVVVAAAWIVAATRSGSSTLLLDEDVLGHHDCHIHAILTHYLPRGRVGGP